MAPKALETMICYIKALMTAHYVSHYEQQLKMPVCNQSFMLFPDYNTEETEWQKILTANCENLNKLGTRSKYSFPMAEFRGIVSHPWRNLQVRNNKVNSRMKRVTPHLTSSVHQTIQTKLKRLDIKEGGRGRKRKLLRGKKWNALWE